MENGTTDSSVELINYTQSRKIFRYYQTTSNWESIERVSDTYRVTVCLLYSRHVSRSRAEAISVSQGGNINQTFFAGEHREKCAHAVEPLQSRENNHPSCLARPQLRALTAAAFLRNTFADLRNYWGQRYNTPIWLMVFFRMKQWSACESSVSGKLGKCKKSPEAFHLAIWFMNYIYYL